MSIPFPGLLKDGPLQREIRTQCLFLAICMIRLGMMGEHGTIFVPKSVKVCIAAKVISPISIASNAIGRYVDRIREMGTWGNPDGLDMEKCASLVTKSLY